MGLSWKHFSDTVKKLAWTAIDPKSVGVDGSSVTVADEPILPDAGASQAPILAEALRRIAERHIQSTAPTDPDSSCTTCGGPLSSDTGLCDLCQPGS